MVAEGSVGEGGGGDWTPCDHVILLCLLSSGYRMQVQYFSLWCAATVGLDPAWGGVRVRGVTPGGVAKRAVACSAIGSCGPKLDGLPALPFATFRAESKIKRTKKQIHKPNAQTNLVAALRWLGPALPSHPSGADRIPTPLPVCPLCSCQVLLLLL